MGINPSSAVALNPEPDPLRRRPLRRIVRNWRQRHRVPFNFWIHMVGIPVAVIGVLLLIWAAFASLGAVPAYEFTAWYWGLGAVVLGYALQYFGHAVEGNDVGEWAAIKRAFGLPYIGIAPRWQTDPQPGKSQV
jgi:uncharacterized membrane protein YGL010W